MSRGVFSCLYMFGQLRKVFSSLWMCRAAYVSSWPPYQTSLPCCGSGSNGILSRFVLDTRVETIWTAWISQYSGYNMERTSKGSGAIPSTGKYFFPPFIKCSYRLRGSPKHLIFPWMQGAWSRSTHLNAKVKNS
jgi:hypothetical protein